MCVCIYLFIFHYFCCNDVLKKIFFNIIDSESISVFADALNRLYLAPFDIYIYIKFVTLCCKTFCLVSAVESKCFLRSLKLSS